MSNLTGLLKLVLVLAFATAAFAGAVYVREGVPPSALLDRLRLATPEGAEAVAAEAVATDAGAARVAALGADGRSFASCTAPAGFSGERILLIGNSLTSYSGMPGTLARLADASGRTAMICAHAPGGQALADHLGHADLDGLLRQGGWSAVVLQEQSMIPAFTAAEVDLQMVQAARSLQASARQFSPGTRVVLYQTPAHRDGRPANLRISSYEAMQAAINASYDRVARTLGATVSPAGEAWQAVRRRNPGIQLYLDDRHPSPAGAYLVAATLATTLFNGDATRLPTLGVDPDAAAAIRWAVAEAHRRR